MTDRVTPSSEPGAAQAMGPPAAEDDEARPNGARPKPSAATESDPAGTEGAVATATGSDGTDGKPADVEQAAGDAAPSHGGEIDRARQAAARNRDQLLRVAADYDNFRKRTARDLEDARRRGRQSAVREMLPVFDNLERATNVGQVTDTDALRDGLRLVHRQFLDTLKKLGVERIDPVGAPFDPTQHESIHLIESAEHPAGTIVSVVQPGYQMGAELLRPAMVVVSKGPPAAAPDEASSSGVEAGGAGQEGGEPQR
jgi:molecular chaperone GrpE